jgi:hypothetical protein
MNWFRHIPRRREESRLTPHHSSPMSDKLWQEVEDNRQKLEEHRQQIKEEQKDGKFHRR